MMTDKERVEQSIKLWRWVAGGDGRRKSEWPGWEKKDSRGVYYKEERQSNLCFLCTKWRDNCFFCPLREVLESCNNEGSAFEMWWTSDHKAKHAKTIYNALRRALRRMK